MVKPEWWGYRIRAEAANPFLCGRGIEIGAGASPQRLPDGTQCTYFDKHTTEGLERNFDTKISYQVEPMHRVREIFPNGADFLIAHNVLEHTPSEISALIEWHSYVKDGGTIVISVPLMEHTTGDQRRLRTPCTHLLDDFIFKRDDASFEAREHSYGFCLNWDASGWAPVWKAYDRDAFVNYLLKQATSAEMDIHWHALNQAEWQFVICAAARFGRRSIRLLKYLDPTSEINPTQGEAIFIYQIDAGNACTGFPDITKELQESFDRYRSGAAAVATVLDR